LFESLGCAVRNFVDHSKERVFCEITYKKIGGVSSVPRGNIPAFATPESDPFPGRIIESVQRGQRRTTDIEGELLAIPLEQKQTDRFIVDAARSSPDQLKAGGTANRGRKAYTLF
jgi:hypothetical protein